MKLIDARITKYRSIEDSETIRIEPDVTCLVGKNESGKTASLQALFRLSPVDGAATLDEDIDYPARLTRQRRQLPKDQRIPVVTATLEFDQTEVETIEDELGGGVLESSLFEVTVGYRSKTKTFAIPYDEQKAVAHLRSTLDLPAGDAAALAEAQRIKDLLEALDALEEPPAAARELAEQIRGWREQDLGLHLIDTYA